MAPPLVLFESAVGYALFEIKDAEEIGAEVDSVQRAMQDLAKFGKIVKLKSLMPFQSAEDALDNINHISEGLVHERLRQLLERDVPKAENIKKAKPALGVTDSKIGQAIAEELSIKCDHTGVVPELVRGIRLHFTKMHKSFVHALDKAQLGLGHSYSRGKVKFNVNRADNMIIQAICLLDQLDKDINTFSMRIKEWYSYHFPELSKIVTDNTTFSRVAKLIGHRKTLSDDSLEALEELTMDSAKAQQILDASRSSMGMDINEIDLTSVKMFADRVISLAEYRQSLSGYLESRMHACAPNLASLVGDQVGARLISHAGSLTNLAKYPASTVQILGAEKALFRALKTKGNTPKYGLIFHSTFIGRAGAKNKGRISRYLANKCSIASRIDCFSDTMTSKFGEALRSQVEERLEFYESGTMPRKNVDVMHGVVESLDEAEGTSIAPPSETPKSKKKKSKRDAEEAGSDDDKEESSVSTPVSAKKAKKAKKSKETPDSSKKDKKKKKKRKSEA